MPFSDSLVFVNESGDQDLTEINPEFPVFVLRFYHSTAALADCGKLIPTPWAAYRSRIYSCF